MTNRRRRSWPGEACALARQLERYGRYLLGRRRGPARRFVIVTLGRSGSTPLVDLLDQHPDVHCDREIFWRWVPIPRLHAAVRASLCARAVYGCKVILGLAPDRPPEPAPGSDLPEAPGPTSSSPAPPPSSPTPRSRP